MFLFEIIYTLRPLKIDVKYTLLFMCVAISNHPLISFLIKQIFRRQNAAVDFLIPTTYNTD